MQPWSGHRRERSSSVVLLGKLSAIVRRGSVLQDPEDARGSSSEDSSNEGSSNEDKDGDTELDVEATVVARHSRRSSMSTVMTMWDPRSSTGSSNGRATQRFQFYPARPLVAAALARTLTTEELERRAVVEDQIDSFGAMHKTFAPPSRALPDDKEEKEGLEMDNNQQETLEEERRATRSGGEEEVEETEDDDDGELLDFGHKNMGTSVRRLMKRIKSESLMRESEVSVACTTSEISNQDDDDIDNFGFDNNIVEDEYRSSSDEGEAPARVEQEPVQKLNPVEHRLKHRRRTNLLSFTAEQAALQDQLTSSMRRLVIQLKDDSDQMSKPLAQSHGLRRKSFLKPSPTRQRAGSCPDTYDLLPPDILSPRDGTPIPTPVSPVFQHEAYPAKKHKKSAFSRIGPRVLETLHLRKKRKTYLFTDEELENIEGARWKIVELAFRFGGKHRSYLVQALNMFFPLLKYGRRGGGHATRLHCNCCGTLQWQHKRGGLSEAVDLAEVLQVVDGRQTAVFRKYGSNSALEACSFSVVFLDRTLDLETQSLSHRDWLVSALRTLVAYARRQRRIEQQAIAERGILPLEDDMLPEITPHARSLPPPAPTSLRLDDKTMKTAMPPNYRLRTVY